MSSSSSSSSSKRTRQEECDICCFAYTGLNPKITCPKCRNQYCLKCLRDNTRARKIFPICINCDLSFDTFSLSDQLTTQQIRSLDPLIKRVVLDLAMAELPKIVEKVERDGFSRRRIPNEDRNKRSVEKVKRIIGKIDTLRRNRQLLIAAINELEQPVIRLNQYAYDSMRRFTTSNTARQYYEKFRNANMSKDNRNDIETMISWLDQSITDYRNIWFTLREGNKYRDLSFVYVDLKGARFPTDVGISLDTTTSTPTRRFIFPCGLGDCQGFLSSRWRCLSCHVDRCKDCNGVKTEDHRCNPDEVASVKLIRNETVRCPKCGTPVYRTFGCDHMFCTVPGCETSFDHQTLTIIPHHKNTNPHYLEWAHKQGLETAADGCTVFSERALTAALIKLKAPKDIIQTVLELYTILDPYNRHTAIDPGVHDNRELLLEKYLAGLIDRDKLKDALFVAHHQEIRFSRENEILDTFRALGRDILHRVRDDLGEDGVAMLPTEIKNLVGNINEAFEYVGRTLKHKSRPYICDYLYFHQRMVFGKEEETLKRLRDKVVNGRPVFQRRNYWYIDGYKPEETTYMFEIMTHEEIMGV